MKKRTPKAVTQSPAYRETFANVMREFYAGKLTSRGGRKVTGEAQAKAIAHAIGKKAAGAGRVEEVSEYAAPCGAGGSTEKPMKKRRRCAICQKLIPPSELVAHALTHGIDVEDPRYPQGTAITRGGAKYAGFPRTMFGPSEIPELEELLRKLREMKKRPGGSGMSYGILEEAAISKWGTPDDEFKIPGDVGTALFWHGMKYGLLSTNADPVRITRSEASALSMNPTNERIGHLIYKRSLKDNEIINSRRRLWPKPFVKPTK